METLVTRLIKTRQRNAGLYKRQISWPTEQLLASEENAAQLSGRR
jgi:hypothetical protein